MSTFFYTHDIVHLCPMMMYFDAMDFSECHSKIVRNFFRHSVYLLLHLPHLPQRIKSNQIHKLLREEKDVLADQVGTLQTQVDAQNPGGQKTGGEGEGSTDHAHHRREGAHPTAAEHGDSQEKSKHCPLIQIY